MRPIELAILRTVLYGEVFNFAMTAEEIHHFLIHDSPVAFTTVLDTLADSRTLDKLILCDRGYFARAGRADLIDLRLERETLSQSLWGKAMTCGAWLARLPFVRMVALTGSLAVRNPSDANDDLDYMLVTLSGRVWTARAFAVVLVRLFKLRGVTICPNFVVAEDALEQTRRDLYIAHEVTQMVTLYDGAAPDVVSSDAVSSDAASSDAVPSDAVSYNLRFRQENGWVSDFLPNADAPFHRVEDVSEPTSSGIKPALEWLLGGRMGIWFEAWERRRKVRRLQRQFGQSATPAAQIDDSQVKGHFNDHGERVLKRYRALLRECEVPDVLERI